MFYVYIIKSEKNNRYYVGSSENPEKRIKEHNSGKSKSTKPYAPYNLVYSKKYDTLSEARKRENYIKNRKSRRFIEDLICGNK